MAMPEPGIVLIVGLTFLLAGAVKGVIGLGLPTVSLGVLAAALDLNSAMALMLIPSFATNLWQALIGGNFMVLMKRLWPFLLPAMATVWLGGMLLSNNDGPLPVVVLGALLVTYAAVSLAGVRFTTTPKREPVAGPVIGAINGALTGLTGSFAVPGVMYLQSLGLDRNAMVQAMGILFTLSTLALAGSLASYQLLNHQLATVSALAVLPALVGMWFGSRVRRRLSEVQFRQVFFWSILLIGLYIIVKPLIGAA